MQHGFGDRHLLTIYSCRSTSLRPSVRLRAVSAKVLTTLVERCSRYYWQGNIRQLFQVLNVLVTEAFGDECDIRAEDLPEFKTMLAPGRAQSRGEKIQSDNPSVEAVLSIGKSASTPTIP